MPFLHTAAYWLHNTASSGKYTAADCCIFAAHLDFDESKFV